MKLPKHLLFLLLLSFHFSFACKCIEHKKELQVTDGLRDYQVVFYGELLRSDETKMTYSFKVLEWFKGQTSATVLQGVSQSCDCDYFPLHDGLWLVYANFNKDKTISISMCSPSQAMDFGPGLPPPPFKRSNATGKMIEMNKAEKEIDLLKWQQQSMQNFIYQLEKLRAYKVSQNSLTREMQTNLKNNIIIGSLIINALLLLTIIVLIVSKKSANNRIPK